MNKPKRFAYRFAVINYVLMGVMIAIFLGYTVFTILKLAEVGSLLSYYPALDIVLMVLLFALTGYIVWLVGFSCYKVDDKHLVVWHLKHLKVETDKILLMRYELSTKTTVLYYADACQADGVGYVVVNVFEKDRQAFVTAIQHANPRVGLEMFDQSKKDEKDE